MTTPRLRVMPALLGCLLAVTRQGGRLTTALVVPLLALLSLGGCAGDNWMMNPVDGRPCDNWPMITGVCNKPAPAGGVRNPQMTAAAYTAPRVPVWAYTGVGSTTKSVAYWPDRERCETERQKETKQVAAQVASGTAPLISQVADGCREVVVTTGGEYYVAGYVDALGGVGFADARIGMASQTCDLFRKALAAVGYRVTACTQASVRFLEPQP